MFTTARRILSLHFPHLATDRLARKRWGLSWRSKGRPEHAPVVCFAKIDNAEKLTALDEKAEALGLSLDLGLAEARAMYPRLDAIETDQTADSRFLEALADWCDRYTPLVALDGADGLMLDITGCAHLFGGEEALLKDLLGRLRHLGLDAAAAISMAPGLSWAAARYRHSMVVAEPPAEVLKGLPVAALRLETETVASLQRVGLKKVGDLLVAPRAPLTRRFGPCIVRRLDQALGREDEPISPRRPVAEISAERRLEEPVATEEAILALGERLAESVKSSLEARGEGGRLFELLLFRVDGRVFRMEVATSMPTRVPERINGLFRERLEKLKDEFDAGFGFEIIRLSVLIAEALAERQVGFRSAGPETGQDAFLAFADQVEARLGGEILLIPVETDSHWPEKGSSLVPVSDGEEACEPRPPVRGSRPLRLFSPPEQVTVVAEVPDGPPASFNWRRVQHRVLRAEGPERLASEWWRGDEKLLERDYFRIEDQNGHRFWLYREGLYERGTVAPHWFMHGIFS